MERRNEKSTEERFGEVVTIMAQLRAPDGRPWDREQSFDSIRKYTLEEAYEVFDAIEKRDWPHLKEELGDLLLQVLFYAQMASEAGYFTIADVIDGLNRKLIRRHPHVFPHEKAGEDEATGNGFAALPAMKRTPGIDAMPVDTAQVLRNWEAIKIEEKKAAGNSTGDTEDAERQPRLASIPRSLPALMEAQKLGSRAAKSGFDWPDTQGLFVKLDEETAELQAAIAQQHQSGVEDEVGDMFFTLVNLARHLNIDPEMALRRTNAKFRSRFSAMEQAQTAHKPLEQLTAAELEELWSIAKERERNAEQILDPGKKSEQA